MTCSHIMSASTELNYPSCNSPSCDSVHVHRLVEQQANLHPERTAILNDGHAFSYRQLNATANRLVGLLRSLNVTSGAGVCVLLPPCPAAVICQLAILKSGAVYIPLDTEHPPARLASIIDDVKPVLVVTQTPFSHLIGNEIRRLLFSGFDDPLLQTYHAGNLGTGSTDESPAYVFFTSGTTGSPKGVIGTQGNLAHYVTSAIQHFAMGPHTVMPTVARLTFSISLFDTLCPLAAGGAVVIVRRDVLHDMNRLCALLESVSMVHVGPSLLNLLLRHLSQQAYEPERFQHLRHLSSGGDLVRGTLVEKLKHYFPASDIHIIYGCTEIACMGCTYPVPHIASVTRTWIGKPFPGVTALLLDNNRNPVNTSVAANIYIAGPGVCHGYLNRPELTASRFVQINGQRFYDTGDIGIRHSNGDIEILGRNDYQIQLHGIRIEPGEIEHHLLQIPSIKEVVIWPAQQGEQNAFLVGYLVVDTSRPPRLEDILAHLRAHLPKYMIPAKFVVLAQFPVNHNLKLDRNALPPPSSANMLTGINQCVAAEGKLEQDLLDLWKTWFQRESMGVCDDFFDLGGDSLLAINLIGEVARRFGQQLDLSVFLAAPTVRQLARWLETPTNHIPSDLLVLKKSQDGPSLFLIHGALVYKELTDNLPAHMTVCALYRNDEAEYLHRQDMPGLMGTYGSIGEMAMHYLKLIRQFQPVGPYHLAGYSIGGLMAHEMAHQLQLQQESVETLILIDAHTPGFLKKARLRKTAFHIGRLLSLGIPHLKYLTWKISTLLFSKIPSIPSADIPSPVSRERNEELRRLARANASAGYQPPPLSSPGVLIKATDRPRYEVSDPTLGWSSYFDQLQIHAIAGSHHQILTGAGAVRIADIVAHLMQPDIRISPSSSKR